MKDFDFGDHTNPTSSSFDNMNTPPAVENLQKTAQPTEPPHPSDPKQTTYEQPRYAGDTANMNTPSYTYSSPQGMYRPYTAQPSQPYSHQPQYNQQSGQISYTPAPLQNKKKNRTATAPSAGVIALVCCVTIAFCGLFGFVGSYLANIMPFPDSGSNLNSNIGKTPMVVYKDVSEITDSTTLAAGETLTYRQVAELVADSVVEITTEYNVQSAWYQYVTGGAGSGVIISADGYIITNTHVVTNESTGALADNITVRLTSTEEYKASIVGCDADSDIAILKINATGLTPAICGDSEKIAVGEEVVVVGNPLGELGGTVTNGIISATKRQIQVNGVVMNLLQTNAAVSPGNSGGGMFNMKGQLIGIINAKSTGSYTEGLGFAIPVNDALSVSEQLMQYGYVRGKATIGVIFRKVTNSNSFFFYYNIKEGTYVAELEPGYNDDVLMVGDRVVAVDGSTITSYADIKALLADASVGDVYKFQIERNGRLIEADVTCYEKVPDNVSGNIQFEDNNG